MIIAFDGPFGTGKSTIIHFFRKSKFLNKLIKNDDCIIEFITFPYDESVIGKNSDTVKRIDNMLQENESSQKTKHQRSILKEHEMFLYLLIYNEIQKKIADIPKTKTPIFIIDGYLVKMLAECFSIREVTLDKFWGMLSFFNIAIPDLQFVFSHGNNDVDIQLEEDYKKAANSFLTKLKEDRILNISVVMNKNIADRNCSYIMQIYAKIKEFLKTANFAINEECELMVEDLIAYGYMSDNGSKYVNISQLRNEIIEAINAIEKYKRSCRNTEFRWDYYIKELNDILYKLNDENYKLFDDKFRKEIKPNIEVEIGGWLNG